MGIKQSCVIFYDNIRKYIYIYIYEKVFFFYKLMLKTKEHLEKIQTFMIIKKKELNQPRIKEEHFKDLRKQKK